MLRTITALLAAIAFPASADVWTFETPSRNIQCSVGEGLEGSDIRCTIIERGGTPPIPRPATCGSDWGHTFEMLNRGPARILCGPTDRSKSGQSVADYGVQGRFGGFVCDSSRSGLECRNEDGHGFFLSRRVQRLF